MVRTRVWDRWHDDASCPGQGSNHGAALIFFLFLALISFLFLTKVVVFVFFHTVLRQRLYKASHSFLFLTKVVVFSTL